MHALVIAAPDVLRERLRIRSTRQLVAACARLRVHASWDMETTTTAATLRSLARRIRELTAEAADHRQGPSWCWSEPGDPTYWPGPGWARSWPPPCYAPGPILGRCRTDAAFAMLGGAAPIPASSGQTVRVRLSRSGDRQLNQALYTVALTRLRTDPATRAYATRRRAQGKTNREIKRCLVRYVARQLYRLLETQPALDATEERPPERAMMGGLSRPHVLTRGCVQGQSRSERGHVGPGRWVLGRAGCACQLPPSGSRWRRPRERRRRASLNSSRVRKATARWAWSTRGADGPRPGSGW
jgi:hypothetical protein